MLTREDKRNNTMAMPYQKMEDGVTNVTLTSLRGHIIAKTVAGVLSAVQPFSIEHELMMIAPVLTVEIAVSPRWTIIAPGHPTVSHISLIRTSCVLSSMPYSECHIWNIC